MSTETTRSRPLTIARRELLLLAACGILPEKLLAQDAARVQSDSYRVALDNAHVRVLEFNALPGMGVCGSGIHSHPAHLGIALTDARVRVTQGGKRTTATVKSGTVFWEEAVTHEVENLTGTNVRSLIVELKQA